MMSLVKPVRKDLGDIDVAIAVSVWAIFLLTIMKNIKDFLLFKSNISLLPQNSQELPLIK